MCPLWWSSVNKAYCRHAPRARGHHRRHLTASFIAFVCFIVSVSLTRFICLLCNPSLHSGNNEDKQLMCFPVLEKLKVSHLWTLSYEVYPHHIAKTTFDQHPPYETILLANPTLFWTKIKLHLVCSHVENRGFVTNNQAHKQPSGRVTAFDSFISPLLISSMTFFLLWCLHR